MLQAWAQEETRTFDKQKLEEIWGDEAFDQSKKQASVPFYGPEPLYASPVDESFGDSRSKKRVFTSKESVSRNGEVAQTFMYGLAGLLLLVIIVLVLQHTVRGSGQRLQSDSIMDLGEGELQTLDTQGLIAQAVAQKDYRLAVRLQYLDVLKKLDEKNWIKWSVNKTNQDYARELSKRKLGPAFNLLTYHFDYTWYGDFHIEEALYKNLESQFLEFHRKIKTK